MPKTNLTEIVAIIDKSGSMWSIAGDAIGGFNQFIEEQRKETGDANVSIILFDNTVYPLAEGIDVNAVTLLNEKNYRPNGGTALYDAIGNAITSTHNRVDALPEGEKPERFIFAILTDGAENASKEYSREAVEALIKDKTDNSDWQFIFLAANIDAKSTAESIGIKGEHAMNFAFHAGGIAGGYSTMSKSVSMYRSGEKIEKLESDYDDCK